ncbi:MULTISPECIES: metal ABC transporter solute-binding protein, Zn/Mn family [Lysinibacillus]|uniref:metal ABC transporter solute-binding protein, Zn/Mn family n=1 Tax=Lysinibacillus TaxID=400634 RepID=UPI0025797370|nr:MULTISPECIES: zinc ABC transporter substrate-binding protein [Lysinibacillus]
MKRFLGVVVFSLSLLLFGCSTDTTKEDREGVVVATTGQIADAIKAISGGHLRVSALMGPGVDPHLYKATQSDLSKLDKAEVIFYNGLHLEGQMLDIFEQMSKSKSVLAVGETLNKSDLLASDDDAMLHDPHIWFDIELWKGVVQAIGTKLQEEYPEFKDDFVANEKEYLKQLDELQVYAKDRVNEIPEKQRILVTAHDAFNYFGRSQGFDVRGLQGLSTDSEYGVKDVQEMVDFLVANKIKAIFIESSVSDKAMKAVIEGAKEKGHDIVIGGELFSDAMGAEGTKEGTYIGMYQHNIDTIVDALK